MRNLTHEALNHAERYRKMEYKNRIVPGSCLQAVCRVVGKLGE